MSGGESSGAAAYRESLWEEIPGFRVGHAQDMQAATGCTVAVCANGAVAGVDVRGGSPGTLQTDTLDARNAGGLVHAVLLAGGSAFGLAAATGVSRFLEERGVGRDVQAARVPVVCGAILFDLLCGDSRVRPDAAMGYAACRDAFAADVSPQGEPARQGNVGAGTGAVVGKIRGMEHAMKGGLGTCGIRCGELLVSAVVAVNCVGDVYDPRRGAFLAGMLDDGGTAAGGSEAYMLGTYQSRKDFFSGNTVIGAVLTNARLTKPRANKLASMAQDGIARTIRPSHCIFDGDTLFALSSGEAESNISAVGILAVRAVERAIVNGVQYARPLAGFPSAASIGQGGPILPLPFD